MAAVRSAIVEPRKVVVPKLSCVIPIAADASVGEVAVARRTDGQCWLVWRVDGGSRAESAVHVALTNANRKWVHSSVVARGAQDGLMLGTAVCAPDDGVAVTWRGDEGLGWFAEIDPRGRRRRLHFLEPCASAPMLVSGEPDGWRVAWREGEAEAIHVRSIGEEGLDEAGLRITGGSFALAKRGQDGVVAVGCMSEGSIRLCELGSAGPNWVAVADSAGGTARSPALVSTREGWLVAWIVDDGGRASLRTALAGHPARQIAEVWSPTEALAQCAPSLAVCPDGLVRLLWREHRGSQPALYLRTLDERGAVAGTEERAVPRGWILRSGVSKLDPNAGACAFVARGDAGDGLYLLDLD